MDLFRAETFGFEEGFATYIWRGPDDTLYCRTVGYNHMEGHYTIVETVSEDEAVELIIEFEEDEIPEEDWDLEISDK